MRSTGRSRRYVSTALVGIIRKRDSELARLPSGRNPFPDFEKYPVRNPTSSEPYAVKSDFERVPSNIHPGFVPNIFSHAPGSAENSESTFGVYCPKEMSTEPQRGDGPRLT